ncbi:hypothetical protein ACWC9T_04730 [Kitasatospora sp. NPDC001159]
MRQPSEQSAVDLTAPLPGCWPPATPPSTSAAAPARPVRTFAPTAVVLLVLVPLAAHDPDFGPTTSPHVNAGTA